jgi:hypothetical protein
MTSESHPAVEPRRRPAPPGPASAPEYTVARPVSYVPDAYDPKQLPAVAVSMPGQFGVVYPAQRTGRSVWFALSLIVASVIAFVGWRAQQSGASDSSAGLSYTSTAGHFSAHFPAQPTELVKSERRGPLHIVIHLSGVPGQAVVAATELTGPIHGDAQGLARRLVGSLTNIDDSELSSVKKLRVQGSPARQGNFFGPTTGELYSVLMVAPSIHRFYLLMAPTGPDFDALKASFRMLS